ncbi:hypothetical protein GCM10009122_02040 [Fulvivirga kasyanovii]|uniref:NADH-quinone oxidoreductase subunit C n=1 Tax=Fulvivirga kasyanovii TaxID=396812 RepID=A0ABW9RW68_9BACT|nr:NADH-quinone oxidoreductase subunit C [Fulvivirga kasyanovii]MTI28484.1 NADH-quinone oxidoreductase subunit C [Fulvivirga kasyanovii]
MELEDITSILKDKFGDDIIREVDENASPQAIVVSPTDIHRVCLELHTNERAYFDMLSCLTGLDNGPEAGTMEVIYNMYSVPYEIGLMIRVKLDRNKPEVNTVSDIWKTADWHEREAYDMYGIKFVNHPDLRRILLPADWEGYPLRKDYQHQEYYRGIKVEY